MTLSAEIPLPAPSDASRPAGVSMPDTSRASVAELLRHLVEQAREWQDQLAAEPAEGQQPAGAADAVSAVRPAEDTSVTQQWQATPEPHPDGQPDVTSGFGRAWPAGAELPTIALAQGQLEVRSRLKALVDSATESLIWSRQGAGAHNWGGIRAVSAQTCRSLDVRVLLRLAQPDVPTAVQVWQRATWQGAEVRVLPPDGSAIEFLVVDGRTACLASLDQNAEPTLREITDPALVTVLTGAFTLAWSGAAKLDEAEALSELLDSDVTRAVLEMLVEGAKDETIARTIGISLRTCRRHAATIMSALTSVSRFQAGYHLGRANGIATALRELPGMATVAVPGLAD